MDTDRLKTAAVILRRELAARGIELGHSQALEIAARQYGLLGNALRFAGAAA